MAGPGRAILSGERVALNFMQRMSGIATRHAALRGRGRRHAGCDPGHAQDGPRPARAWISGPCGWAAGVTTAFGLYDMALIKDNHIAAVGSITEAVRRVRAGDPAAGPSRWR